MEEMQDEIEHYTNFRTQLQKRLQELLQQQERYQKFVDEYHEEQQKLPKISAMNKLEFIAKVRTYFFVSF